MTTKIIFIILSYFSLVYPQKLLTIREAIEVSLKNNYSISIARGQKQISDNNATPGNAGFFPDLSAEGSYSESNNTTRQEYFDGRLIDRQNARSENLSASATLSWTIFDGLEMFATYDLLKQLRDAGEIDYKITIENNITDLTLTYFDIVRQQSVLEVIQRSIEISNERVRLVEEEKNVGTASKFELLQAQVDLNEDRSLLLQAELSYAQSKTLLNRLMGRNPEEDFLVEDTIIINTDLYEADLKNSAFNNNSAILKAQHDKSIAEAQLNIIRSNLFPEISLFGSYNFVKSESAAGFTKSNQNRGYTYGLRASINLFNGLNTRREIENANIQTEISELGYQSTVNSIEAEFGNLFKQYQNSLRLVLLESENLKVTEENVSIALERLRLGNITPLEFRESQVNLIDAQSRLVNAQYQAKSAETQLLRVSGQLIKE